ncbi:MAG: cobalamin-dependent protein, partial [Candidatus Omnitrophota bacterium]
MKIAFINDSAQQLGIQYMSAVLKQHGHDVKLFMDPQLFDDDMIRIQKFSRWLDYKKELVRRLKAYQPDLIGISVVTDFYQWACRIAMMIKEEMNVPIIAGGIHPTSVPERVLKNDCFDMVCLGEGEFPLLELADSLQRGQPDYTIRNIWFKRDGHIIKNELRPLIEDLDTLPLPDTDLYYSASPHFKRTGLYVTMTSRGCPNACSYC